MSVEHQIKNYPECRDCDLLARAISELEEDPRASGKDVILNQCHPKLSLIGLHGVTLVGLITDKGRIERLQRLSPNGEVSFIAPMIILKMLGNCEPLIQETAEKTTDKILGFLD